VIIGGTQALWGVLAAVFTGAASELRGREIWLKFATWILLGLEFALAADLVKTAITPTWDDVGKLAVIAVIRTMLNYFLAKDITAFDEHMPQAAERDLGRPRRTTRRRAEES
jgi:uncharacterized membrane protein